MKLVNFIDNCNFGDMLIVSKNAQKIATDCNEKLTVLIKKFHDSSDDFHGEFKLIGKIIFEIADLGSQIRVQMNRCNQCEKVLENYRSDIQVKILLLI